MGLLCFYVCGYEEEWSVDDGHYSVIESLVGGRTHPPFERDDEEEDFNQVERYKSVDLGDAPEIE